MTTRTYSRPALALPDMALRGLAPWRLSHLLALHRQRRNLAALDAHLLDDIGVSRAEAQREAERPVWDVPRTWLR